MSRTVLVLGSEAHGLSEGVRGALTRRVAIGGGDRRRGTESLNVAVAGGILLHRWASAG
jgi:tRNA G18 (ribose-2'-O)-methylase SpoU